jgi:pyridoxamine 5'-phosphate oxidase
VQEARGRSGLCRVLQGRTVLSPDEECDEYFASRALDSRIGAWASLQSEVLDSRRTLLKRVAREAARFGTSVPRPPHWGGYRLWPEALELWIEGAFRVHDRARWTRELTPLGESGFKAGPWLATRLYP